MGCAASFSGIRLTFLTAVKLLLVAASQAVQELVRAHAERLVLTQDGLQREFFVSFISVPTLTKLRHLMARHLGQLVCFAGARNMHAAPQSYNT